MVKAKSKKTIVDLPEDASPVGGHEGLYATRSGRFFSTVQSQEEGEVRHLPGGMAILIAGSKGRPATVNHGGESLDATELLEATFPEIARERMKREAEDVERRRLADERNRRVDEEQRRRWAEERERKESEEREIADISEGYWSEVESGSKVMEIKSRIREARRGLVSAYREKAEEYGWNNVRKLIESERELEAKEATLKGRMIQYFQGGARNIEYDVQETAKSRLRLEREKAECRATVGEKGPGEPWELFRGSGYRSGNDTWPYLNPREEEAARRGDTSIVGVE